MLKLHSSKFGRFLIRVCQENLASGKPVLKGWVRREEDGK
jgi:hypothetical protein